MAALSLSRRLGDWLSPDQQTQSGLMMTGWLLVRPWVADSSFTVSTVLFEATTGMAGAQFVPAIYADENRRPGPLIWAPAPVDVTPPGGTYTVSDVDVAITAGRVYWFGGGAQGSAPAINVGLTVNNHWLFPVRLPDPPPLAMAAIRREDVSGTLPDPFGPWTPIAGVGSGAPRLFLQVA